MIVLGAGFGDEGKGQTVSFLCSRAKKPLVIRFNGGHQAGHTVNFDGKRHVFSSFGSGTLQGVPTFWGEDCTFYPIGFMNEYRKLKSMDVDPKITVHPECPVTTPFDVDHNQKSSRNLAHGTVGVGFGATLWREENHRHLLVRDLLCDSVMHFKLMEIGRCYGIGSPVFDRMRNEFLTSVAQVREIIEVSETIPDHETSIGEAQCGIMMDQKYGFFPNVTRSNTTSKNMRQIGFMTDDVMYVTRTYQTRHGIGPMTNEDRVGPTLENFKDETNVNNQWQGPFRKTILDVNLLRHALQCDAGYSQWANKHLMITCVDQTGETIRVTIDNREKTISVRSLPHLLGVKFSSVHLRADNYVTEL